MISVRGDRARRGISPHCAASVAEAPDIMTIEIGISAPLGGRFSRSMMKKPRQVSVAACAWPASTPATIHCRTRGSFQLTLPDRAAVDATTLAPVVAVASEG